MPNNTKLRYFKPGDYSWQEYKRWDFKPVSFLGDGEWHLMAPDGHVGAIRATTDKPCAHTWIEHEDNTVSFSPSIVMPNGWHGFLRNGEWSQ